MDEEALRYYREATRMIENEEDLLATFNLRLASYYSKSKRNGLSLPYVKKYLSCHSKKGDTSDVINGYVGLSVAYGDMGEAALRDHYETLALNLAQQYFRLGPPPSPSDRNQWITYGELVKSRMDSVAVQGNKSEVMRMWSILEPITEQFLGEHYVNYLYAAERLALSGEPNGGQLCTKRHNGVGRKEREGRLL
jgi:tetratricopeptide (TPR) repeat protein